MSKSRMFDIKAPMKKADWQYEPDKSAWVRLGYATQQEDGRIVCTMNTVPVGDRWDGTFTLFPRETNG